MPKPISKRDAEALFARLHELLIDTERVLIDIIERKAWAALGYPSFEAAWLERMEGVRLATDAMKAHVIYALLDTSEPQEVAAVIGSAPDLVETVARQKRNGVPASHAVVRRHIRRNPSEPTHVLITLTAAERARFAAIAEARGSNLADMATLAVRNHFARMGKRASA